MSTTTTTVTRTGNVPVPKKSVYKDSNGRDFTPPNFTSKDILEAIPPRCMERSTLRSLSYVARDLLLVGMFGFAATYIQYLPNVWLRGLAWALYSVCQGMVGTGIWVLAHECGHRSFSPSNRVNDTVGWLLHSALLVPYHSWRLSHSKHHKATGHLERDMVFVPKTKSEFIERRGQEEGEGFFHLVEETPLATAFWLVVQQLFGWPAYLFADVTGRKWPSSLSSWKINHFVPTSPIFDRKDRNAILLSDLGLLLTGCALYQAVQSFGWANVTLFYGIPYLWVNHWLVAITYLQHTDPTLPHYTGETWTFSRGASATIDRDFGFIGRHVFHGIIETHVAHHFVSRIPHYHADEATLAVKKVMGSHYRHDSTNFLLALWRNVRTCRFIDDDGDVRFFRSITPGGEYVQLLKKHN